MFQVYRFGLPQPSRLWQWPAAARYLCAIWLLLLSSQTHHLAAAQEATPVAPAPTTWTNPAGVGVEADFVRMTEDGVVLRLKRERQEVTIPLNKLSIESIYQAVRLANPQAFSKPVPKAEIKAETTVELPQLALDVDDMLVNPFTPNMTIEQFFETYQRLPSEGNFFVIWHGLPPKMQTDIEEIIIKGYEVLGASTVKQLQILIVDLNTILRDKKQFILALPEIAQQPEIRGPLEQAWPLVASFVDALAKEEHWQASNFRKGNVTRWLAKLNIDVAPSIMAAMQAVRSSLPEGAADSFELPKYTIVSQSATIAEIEISLGSAPPMKRRYQKVGDVWIDVAAMNQLRQAVDAAKAKLAEGAVQEVGLLRSSLGGIIAAVGGLARAGTQQEFNEAVALLRSIGGGLSQSLGLGGPPPAPGRRP